MEKELVKSYIKDGVLSFRELPEITRTVRDVFLAWLSKALENKDGKGKTEDGKKFTVKAPENGEECTVRSDDGILHMPAYTIIFEEDES